MKIGIEANMFNNSFMRWGEKRYEKLKELGYSGADYGMSDTGTVIYTANDAELRKMMQKEKNLAENAGIEIHQVHGPWRWPAQDSTTEDRTERMEKMKKSIYATSLLGCKNWIVHPVMPYGTNEKGTDDAAKTRAINVEFMSELLKTAKEYGVTICLENMPMPGFSLGSPEEILSLVKEVNDDNFKICLDTGHVSVYQEKLSIGEEVRRLGSEIRALHVHDNKVGWDLHMMPYAGIIDWREFAVALKDIGYNGVFSLETVPPLALSDELFEEMCALYAKVAKQIIKDIE